MNAVHLAKGLIAFPFDRVDDLVTKTSIMTLLTNVKRFCSACDVEVFNFSGMDVVRGVFYNVEQIAGTGGNTGGCIEICEQSGHRQRVVG